MSGSPLGGEFRAASLAGLSVAGRTGSPLKLFACPRWETENIGEEDSTLCSFSTDFLHRLAILYYHSLTPENRKQIRIFAPRNYSIVKKKKKKLSS